ncbi:MAG: coenzyme F420-0:L-glutamate ligase [Oscillospiraceae bacterium]|nr:coenzyme F420-0:L-glutamate ligase [Oscillospiraceae bacterium]
MSELKSNEGKDEIIEVDGVKWSRLPIKTHVVTDADDIADVAAKYAGPELRDGDILFISEKCVACTQKRAIKMEDIKPRKLAVILSRHVTKTPHGIGLGIPETMEMALRECGTLRILFAAFCSVIGKLFHKSGWFYIVAGPKASSIDGPCHNTLPPYNHYVVLGPSDPDETAKRIAEAVGQKVMIIDLNDLGGNILGASDSSIDREWAVRALKDNPLGQSHEQTPMGILRKAE